MPPARQVPKGPTEASQAEIQRDQAPMGALHEAFPT